MATLVSSQAYINHCHLSIRVLRQAKEPFSPRRLSRCNHIERRDFSPEIPRIWTLTISRKQQPLPFNTVCFAADEPSPSSSSEISADARIRSEVLSPFRSVRMFFYLAFIASASLGGLIATSRLIGKIRESCETQDEGRREQGYICGDLRGIARLVICAGPADYIEEAFKRSREFTQGLVERGVVVVAYATDGTDTADEEMSQRRRRLWRVAPVFVSEWE
ncbi:unnamed protein product, partial [Thlaspi arvense]